MQTLSKRLTIGEAHVFLTCAVFVLVHFTIQLITYYHSNNMTRNNTKPEERITELKKAIAIFRNISAEVTAYYVAQLERATNEIINQIQKKSLCY